MSNSPCNQTKIKVISELKDEDINKERNAK